MGYIYILSNPKLEGKLKIGKTASHPEIRTKQLNRNTGTYGEYIVEWYKEVEDETISEQLLHHALRDFRTEKELFLIGLNTAVQVADFVIKQLGNVNDEVTKLKDDYKNNLMENIKQLKRTRDLYGDFDESEEDDELKKLFFHRILILESKLNILDK